MHDRPALLRFLRCPQLRTRCQDAVAIHVRPLDCRTAPGSFCKSRYLGSATCIAEGI